jgi:peptide-methionine (R)-S-oxide reductase
MPRRTSPRQFTRRDFCLASATAGLGIALGCSRAASQAEARAADPAADQGGQLVTVVQFSDAGQRGETVRVAKVVKSDAYWRQQLSAAAYQVTRHEDTERPYTGPYWNLHDKGLYRCICCDTALFSSDTKFESGTGWPSFWAPLAKENVVERADLSLGVERTAVSCRRCDGHLGHVFDDGPKPTGLRYCMNSVAMRFVKAG